jgi:hypothetical protein
MIAIVNVSIHDDPVGINDYELRINAKVISKFQHRRADGLAVCLKKAAAAAEKAKWEKIEEFIEAMKS